jgi:hypothetical protein
MAQAKWADLPEEIKERMLQEQVAQGNKRDESVFEKDIESFVKGFDWTRSIERSTFWHNVIRYSNFQTFFDRYPKKELTIGELDKLNNLSGQQPEKRTMVAIKSDGNKERNLRIIQYLESLGGVNSGEYIGILQNNEFYTIEKDGNIGLMWSPEKYTIIDLPEEAKTEPKANVEPMDNPYLCWGRSFETLPLAKQFAKEHLESNLTPTGNQLVIYKAIKTIKATTTITEINHE